MKSKSIVLVSNYYPPERGAAPNRIQVLAAALQQYGYTVEVVCPLPNYPTGAIFSSFKGKVYSKSVENKITVYRLWIWPSNSSNKFIRLLSMLSFSASLQWFFLLKRLPRHVFIQYSPIFVGFTAVFWSWLLRKKPILNISDLWPLAGLEMGLLKKGSYYSLLERIEGFCYRKSHLILGQSQEILSHIASKKVTAPLVLYRNFPAFTCQKIQVKKTEVPIKIVYAGLLGVAQGIAEIVSKITIPEHVEFHVYGDGPDAASLAKLKNTRVQYHGNVSRETLHHQMTQYDVAFIPLVKRIYGSVPSKVFEYARLGLPLLYMAGGEGGDLVSENKLGWVLPVEDFTALQTFLEALTPSVVDEFPKEVIQKRAIAAFNFERQFKEVMKQIEAI